MKKTISLIALCVLTISLNAAEAPKDEKMPQAPYHSAQKDKDKNKPFYYGSVEEVQHGGSYTYINVKENTDNRVEKQNRWEHRHKYSDGNFLNFGKVQIYWQPYTHDAIHRTSLTVKPTTITIEVNYLLRRIFGISMAMCA